MSADSTVERRLRAAIDASPGGLLMTDAIGRIVLVNREIERLFGYAREELLGQPIEILVPDRFRAHHPAFRHAFRREPHVRTMGAGLDLFGRRRDGSEVPVAIVLTPVPVEDGLFVLSSIVDLSERKHAEAERRFLEEQLAQSQKAETVATFAAGIAHDFNNILGAIIGYADLVGDAIEAEHVQAAADLRELVRAAHRGKDLVQRILSLSRGRDVRLKPLALGPVLEEVRKLMRAALPASIAIQLQIHPDVPVTLADAGSVHQLLMHLATNAAQAMPSGGELSLHLERFYLRPGAAHARGVRAGDYARITIADTGVGMDAAVREQIFEPFYTTKSPGLATGLGLSVVHGIMREHHGMVEVDSEPGYGTSVRCYFPALATDSKPT